MKNELCNPIGALDRISGFHQYVLDPPAHLCFASRSLCNLLGTSEAELLSQTEDAYRPFLHPEDCAPYEDFLRRLAQEEQSATLFYRLIAKDGRIIHVIDAAVSYRLNGCLMADSVLTDITGQYLEKEQRESSRYLKALSEVYDKIFEFNLENHTVKCLYGQNSPSFHWLENIPMQMETATENWITSTAAREDQDRLCAFFRDYCRQSLPDNAGHLPQIVYRARSSEGICKTYTGIFLNLDSAVSLYCCRCCQSEQETDALRRENDSLKTMQTLAMEFSEGVVSFEVEDDRVKPMYISENICSFFGYTREAWEELAQRRPTIQELIAGSSIDPADIQKLFSFGEAEFSYYDMTRNTYRRIRAICSRRYNGSGRCYVMLYNLDTRKSEPSEPVVRIRTFGYFDVFVGDQPIAFRNEKSKELFALLTDRRAASCHPARPSAFCGRRIAPIP